MQLSPRVRELLDALTLEEKCSLTAGDGPWRSVAVPRLGIPGVVLTDAQNGARGPFVAFEGPHTSVCVPCGTALGATWDPELIEEVGGLIGEETLTKGGRVLLGPVVNIHRSPLAGRNFEGFSEDPLLAGVAGAAYVRGAQSRGVACTVKHYAANEAEFERNAISSEVDERTLREIYLAPFERAVRDGGALGLMAGYNRLNGTWCAENEALLSLPRDEWGFEGFIVSDWGAVGSTDGSVRAGLDLEMPGPGAYYGKHLADAVRRGEVDEAEVDVLVSRLLHVLDTTGALDEPLGEPATVELPEHQTLARRAAAAAMVLLRNDGLLPLAVDEMASVAVVGPNADAFAMMGGGSAAFHPNYVVSPLDAVREGLPGVEVVHEPGTDNEGRLPLIPLTMRVQVLAEAGDGVPLTELAFAHSQAIFPAGVPGLGQGAFYLRGTGRFRLDETRRYTFSLQSGGDTVLTIDGRVVLDSRTAAPPPGRTRWTPRPFRGDLDLEAGEHDLLVETTMSADPNVYGGPGFTVGCKIAVPEDGIERAVAAAAAADVAIVVVGTDATWETEFLDRSHLELRGRQDELVERVLEVNPRTVVVVNSGAPVAMPWAERAPALVQTWFGGQEMSRALVDVLTGASDPGGRLPTTFPRRIQDTPAYGSFPGEAGVCRYGEGVFVGYRWYTSRDVPVAFPFGHGLSYATFDVGQPTLSRTAAAALPDLEVRVSVPVANIGERSGSEVVQCYIEPPTTRVPRPVRELRAFDKVTLAPGQRKEVVLRLDHRAFARWAPAAGAEALARLSDLGVPEPFWPSGASEGHWHVDPGTYTVHIGRSVEDVLWSLNVEVSPEEAACGRCRPSILDL